MKPFIFISLVVCLSKAAFAVSLCSSFYQQNPATEQSKQLSSRYGIDLSKVEIQHTPELKIPVILRMSTEETLAPSIAPGTVLVREHKKYDSVIVGGGPAGLMAAIMLAEAGKSVLILERNEKLGGLAMGGELKDISAGGGAAYSAGPDGIFEYNLFRKIGLGDYKKRLTIKEPIDSYLWKGKLYRGIWEDHTLQHLPSSFSLFKHALLKLSSKGAADENQQLGQWADTIDMATLVRKMPEMVKLWKDPKSKSLYQKFISDKELHESDPMKDVIDLLDLYGPSALGSVASKVSARVFIDFYSSEIYTRYTGTLGTGTIAAALQKKLSQYKNLVDIRTGAPVAELENTNDGIRSVFIENGVAKEVFGQKAIFSVGINLAPKLIKDLEQKDPEKVKAISEIEMTDYAVHVVRLKGHPYRATYDTWVYSNGDRTVPTDFINGRWQDKKINAYDGTQNFEKIPADDYGVISLYHPLGTASAHNFSKARYLETVEKAVKHMLTNLGPIANEMSQKIDVELVESYRWPQSIHIVHPGFLKKIPVLSREFGNIHFANNTLGSPELETSMARAAREAIKIIEMSSNRSIHKKAIGE